MASSSYWMVSLGGVCYCDAAHFQKNKVDTSSVVLKFTVLHTASDCT